MERSEHDALLALLLAPGLGPTLTNRAIAALGSPNAVLTAGASALSRVDGIGPKRAEGICRGIDEILAGDDVARELELAERHRVRILGLMDPGYPRLLKHIPDPPPLLFVRGELVEQDAVALAVVGSRRCSPYGREQADRMSALCAQWGLCIVSGGAYGVDAAAHRAALRVKGRTIAVLGSGQANPYPTDHCELFDAIADGHGAVVSELPMNTSPSPENFPRRNRIISGLSLGVLVIEAALRSGALITARLAVEEQGREVMALPGRVDSDSSAGCHRLIREGAATLVTNAADVLDALGETGQMLKTEITDVPRANLSDSQRKIVGLLDEAMSLDEITRESGLPVHIIQADLTLLEIRGEIARKQGRFVRRREVTT